MKGHMSRKEVAPAFERVHAANTIQKHYRQYKIYIYERVQSKIEELKLACKRRK